MTGRSGAGAATARSGGAGGPPSRRHSYQSVNSCRRVTVPPDPAEDSSEFALGPTCGQPCANDGRTGRRLDSDNKKTMWVQATVLILLAGTGYLLAAAYARSYLPARQLLDEKEAAS